MDVNQHQRFVLQDKSFASLIKRDITRIAESYGFSQSDVGKINIIVSELISNLLKHTTQGGELLVKSVAGVGLEIICLDNGPGIHDIVRMMRDGTSTAGTAGEGLGAIQRQSDEFDIYSQPGLGTVILSRVFRSQSKRKLEVRQANSRFDVASVMVPKPNEQLCGDGFAIFAQGNDCYLIALDGLGHGANAHEASSQAAASFLTNYTLDPATNIRLIHNDIRKTRGAVGSIAHISASKKTVSYCGVGNIAGRVFSLDDGTISNTNSRSIIAYNGIIGHNIPATFHTHQTLWNKHSLLVLHSDGIKTRWDLSKYPSLHRHDVSIIAAVIYKDNSRHSDDSLVVVVRPKA